MSATKKARPKEDGSRRTRFKPGQSGNPKGRPKGSKNLATLAREILAQSVTLIEGDQKREVTKREAVVLSIVQGAMKGNPKHVAALLKITGEGETKLKQEVQSGVLVVPTVSASAEEWEAEHGVAARGKPPPPEFMDQVRKTKPEDEEN